MLSALIATFLTMPQPVLERGVWLTDFEKAKRYAQATGRPILANFTGSDWCPYCLRLRKEVFSTETFQDWADEKVVLFEADYPRAKELPAAIKKQNDELAMDYVVSGYPYVVFMNSQGEILGQSGYLQKPGPAYWTKYAEKVIGEGVEKLAENGGFPEIAPKQLPAVDFRGEKLPSWEWGTVASGTLPDLKGKTVLIDFWATWCGPCVESMPLLERWSKTLGDDFVVVGITDEDAETVKKFAQRRGITYPLISDTNHKMQDLFQIQTIPQMVLVSGDGIVRWQGSIGDGDPITAVKIRKMMEATR